ncbi:MAG: hypothetical protein D6675_03140, partial [Gemmatimonadetes bacterium]
MFGFGFCSSAFANAIISDQLQDELNTAGETEFIEAIIFMVDQVDTKTLDRQLYKEQASPADRAYTVITALQDKANQTQNSLAAYLDAKTSAEVNQYKSYWIVNAVFVEAIPSVLSEISLDPTVYYMDSNVPIEIDEPDANLYLDPPDCPEEGSEDIECGIRVINAPALWDLGITGTGVVVMNVDTGVDG